MPPTVEPWMTDAVTAALAAVGCSGATAERLVGQAHIEHTGGWTAAIR